MSYYPYTIDFDSRHPIDGDYSTYEWNAFGLEYGAYEPFDISQTYFAPLWGISDRTPNSIAIGHSHDVLGYGEIDRRAPYESPLSMQIHQKYLQEITKTDISFRFPLATLSTYSVFEYIRRRFGLTTLESMHSCWNCQDSDCGYCEKCQRIKLASQGLHLKDYGYLPDMPQVLQNHSTLFYNPLYNGLVDKYGAPRMASSQLF